MSQPSPEPQRLEIRKYPNRRYYDATRSRHLTLEEIHTAIREGCEVRVVDSRTGEDITAKVLAQIIIDLDPPKLEVFPVPLLHGLLRANQKMVGDFIQRYFNQPLSMFLDSQRSFEHYIRNAMGVPGGLPTMADWTRMMLGPLATNARAAAARTAGGAAPAEEPANGSAPPPPPPPAATAPPEEANVRDAGLRNAVDRLSKQVEELEARLAKKIPKKTKKVR